MHGLTGKRDETWTTKKTRVFWPRDLIPANATLRDTRVLSFGYDADIVHFWAPAGQNRVGGHAMNLVKALTDFREKTDTEERPVLFVVHSLGGLVFEDVGWPCLFINHGSATLVPASQSPIRGQRYLHCIHKFLDTRIRTFNWSCGADCSTIDVQHRTLQLALAMALEVASSAQS